ncbi:uncharacterized protein LOC111270379 isoform X4 [Varroa jacobsoni]|uniref:uncharacterized protein LOC111270379 isoform X4 n=1 Tax=Varroa jacobsoni TaxID=62625 RepID=UPI000BF47161|nr:uncharacterized protein LOC111270379 isoform X4 [Varroa jacobsoni]
MQSARELRQSLAEARDNKTQKGRRDSLEKCRNLLKRSILQAELDANGDISSESQGVTWGGVLDLTGVVLRQILQKSRGKETPGTREERDAAVNLLDMVVGLSIQKGGRIKASEVVKLIISMLRDEENRPLVGRQFLRILKQLLRAPHHQANLTFVYYNGLIKIHTSFINQTTVFNPAEVAEMLHALVKAAINFSEVDVVLCSCFLERIVNKLTVNRSQASTGLMLHVLGIWRLLCESYSEEYPTTFSRLANTLLVPTAQSCHDSKDSHLEGMLFLIMGQISLVSDRAARILLLEWTQDTAEKALRFGRLRNSPQLRTILAAALATCAATLMEDKDRFTLDKHRSGDGPSSNDANSASKRLKVTTFELGVLAGFDNYKKARNDLGATSLWLEVVQNYVEKCPSTVTPGACESLIKEVCSEVLVRPLNVRAHLIDVLKSLLIFQKANNRDPSQQVLDVLVRTLDANHCVDNVYSIMDLIFKSNTDTTSVRKALFRGHHVKSEKGMVVLRKLCIHNQISQERYQPLEWIFGLNTNQLAMKANIILALCLKRTSCAFGPGKLTVECLPHIVDEVCHRLNSCMNESVHFLYVAVLFILKICRVRNQPAMLEPLMVGVQEALRDRMKSLTLTHDELMCIIELLQDCRDHFINRVIKFNFAPFVQAVLRELTEKFLSSNRTQLEMAMGVDLPPSDEPDCDGMRLDEELKKLSAMCRFLSLHILVQCKSAEQTRIERARSDIQRLLEILANLPEERLKGPLMVRILALLVQPLLQEQCLWKEDDDQLLEQIGAMLKTQLELTFNKPDLIELIMPSIKNYILCSASVYNDRDTQVTILARHLIRRLIVSFQEFQTHNTMFGKAVLNVLRSAVDIDPKKQWLYFNPSGEDCRIGIVELLVENVNCPAYHIRKEVSIQIPPLFSHPELSLNSKKLLLDLMFDSYGTFTKGIIENVQEQQMQSDSKVSNSKENFTEKLSSSVTLFGRILSQLRLTAPRLTAQSLANCCRLWRAKCLLDENLLELFRSMGDIDELLNQHLSQLLVVWHKRFMCTFEMDETDKSFPFFISKDVRHFMSKFGHIVFPTLLMLGNTEARDAIRGAFGGSLATYFAPVAACCLLNKENSRFFAELTRSLEVDKKMAEFLIPVYTRIILSLRASSELDDIEVTFEADAVAMALGRAASLLQNTQLPQEVESIEPWMPFTLKTVPQAKLLQLIANVVSSPQLIHNPVRCMKCLTFIVTYIVIPLARYGGNSAGCALPAATSMLFARCCQLLLDFSDEPDIRQDCVPALAALLDLGTDTTLLIAPALAVTERLRDDDLTRCLFARIGALTDLVVFRPDGLAGSLKLNDMISLIRSVYFYMTNDQSVHPVRLLARILRHPELRRSLFSMVEHNGLKLQAQDISIKEYPGYVLLAVILDRLKTSSGPETAAIFSCLDTLGAVPLQSWTLRPFLHEFDNPPLPYLCLPDADGAAGSGVIVSFAQHRIVERLLSALQSGSQSHLNVLTDCLVELFRGDIGVEITSSFDSKNSLLADHVAAFKSQKGKRVLPIIHFDEADAQRSDFDLASFVLRIGTEQNEGSWFREATEILIAASVDTFLMTIMPLCQCDEKLCSDIFPSVMYCVHAQVNGRPLLNDLVTKAFGQVGNVNLEGSWTPGAKIIYTRLVQFVCLLHLHGESIDQIDLMAVAQTACLCGLHESSLLLLTLWWERFNAREGKRHPVAFHEYDGKVNMSAVQKILVRCCEALGVRDSLFGCFSRRANDDVVRRALGQPFNHLEILFEKGEFRALRDMVRLGSGSDSIVRTFEQYAVDCAFRLGEWDQVSEDGNPVMSFRESTMLGLIGISSADGQLLEQAVKACTNALILKAANTNLNITYEVIRFLVRVDQVQLLQGYLESRKYAGGVSTAGAWDSFTSASERRFKREIPFEISEEYLWLKTAIFKTLPHIDVGEHLLGYGTAAVQSSKLNLARAALLQLEGVRDSDKLRFAYLQAATQAHIDVNDIMTEQLSARLMADLAEMDADNSVTVNELRARAMLLRGRVLSATQRATPLDIAEHYFKPAIRILEKCGESYRLQEERVRAYRELAAFADDCARGLAEYFHSSAYLEDNNYLAREGNIRSGASELEEADIRHHKLMLRDIDQLKGQIQDKKDSLAGLAVSALSNYLQVLRLAQDQNIKYRVFSLWYSHKDDCDVSGCLQGPMEELTSEKGAIPVHGFADMFYQLAACMAVPISGRKDELFQRLLQQLVLRLSRAHPFHCVPTLLLLANPRLGQQAAQGVNLRTKLEELEDRGKAAQKLLDQLMRDAKLKAYITNLEVLAAAYAELSADISVQQGRGTIKRQSPIVSKNRHFGDLPILTEDIPICPDGNYDHVERIKDFIPEYEICAGLSKPKKMIVRGNRGTAFIQLLKGKDDLRQDAVMQQLFKEVSRLRSDDGQFRVRVRTYKVVPLSRYVGVIEWVRNTTPLAGVLVGRKDTLHEKYNPAGSLHPRRAHAAMQDLAKAPTSEEKKERPKPQPDVIKITHSKRRRKILRTISFVTGSSSDYWINSRASMMFTR